ncbi:MAG TPA: N-acetylmuramoyl-L-alanine amidase [Ktedonobacteraceae bacterium]|jgi:N-acetyl-anhydromuramyl-L-alanine amidase AmpD|nr:N-acetylmuramoyl-L-alanine amidase [Ktedonobacteraceae bacterium]
MHKFSFCIIKKAQHNVASICFIALLLAVSLQIPFVQPTLATSHLASLFRQVADEFSVPQPLLLAICQQEGRLSMNAGAPSIDGGYGCMHLVKNKRANTLDLAAKHLSVHSARIRYDLATNLRAGAWLLHQDALQLSTTHTLPTTLSGWYAAVARYSLASTPSIARMYADALYHLLNTGFQARASNGELITLTPQGVHPDVELFKMRARISTLPSGCVADGKTDYPGAIDCILSPQGHDCNLVPDNAPCNYFPSHRPANFTIKQVVIHDIEGTGLEALNTFLSPTATATAHYIVDSDGTVYQTLHEKDIAFQAGNLWYNKHSIGIEHAGYAATGFLWYNATEYLASARLVAYLLKKYHIPLDHDHIVSHGTIPSPTLSTSPNHVDPGPFWLWDYYEQVISTLGSFTAQKISARKPSLLTLSPDQAPLSPNGTEQPANFGFFYLYSAPSTRSPLVPHPGEGWDIANLTYNVETRISYVATDKVLDPAGSGLTLYHIWYGVEDPTTHPTHLANARQVWLAAPASAVLEDYSLNAVVVTLHNPTGDIVPIYGTPTTNTDRLNYHIGNAPSGALFASAYTVKQDGAAQIWYEINFNHRQAWVPARYVAYQKTR